jgi:serine/threonine-protein kinase
VDVRADIYSLGATLYFLLAGRPLFPEGRTAQKLVWQQIKEPVPIDRLRAEVPPALAAVVHRMLQKRPTDRYSTAAEVFEALAPFDSEALPLPDPSLIPELQPRVAMARGAVPGPAAPRSSGSTSHIVVAALRTGTGSSSAALKKERDAVDRDTIDPDAARIGGSRERPSPFNQPTQGNEDDTTPERRPVDVTPFPPRPPATPTPTGPTALIISLSVALVLALAGIVVLLLRK